MIWVKLFLKIQHLKISYNYCWTQIGTTLIVTNNPTITLNQSFQNKVWDTQRTSILYVGSLLTWTEMIFFVFRGVGIEMFFKKLCSHHVPILCTQGSWWFSMMFPSSHLFPSTTTLYPISVWRQTFFKW